MAEARAASAWAHTSAVLALLANAFRDPRRSRAFSPADFHPFERMRGKETQGKTKDLSILRDVFVRPVKKEET